MTRSPGHGDRLAPHLWHLDPDVAHLNHGSYGAVPIPVMDAQLRIARAVERSPEAFYRARLAPAIEEVRTVVARFLGADPEGLALVQNATEAAQVVLETVDLAPGDEVVGTDHSYPWVRAAIERACAERGARARFVSIPVGSDGAVDTSAFVAAILDSVSERTALVALDQITSASALRLPVEQVLDALASDVPVMVDGAHAPGLIDCPARLGATFWLGNLHKWAFAPRTAAALVVAPTYRERVRPLVESARLTDGYPRAFDYLGTQDVSAFLALPDALAFPEDHLGLDFAALRERNRGVLAAGLERVASYLAAEPAPDNGLPMRTFTWGRDGGHSSEHRVDHIGGYVGDHFGAPTGDHAAAARLTTRLRDEGVEVAIVSIAGRLHARVSAQAYVAIEDFDRLGAVLARSLQEAS